MDTTDNTFNRKILSEIRVTKVHFVPPQLLGCIKISILEIDQICAISVKLNSEFCIDEHCLPIWHPSLLLPFQKCITLNQQHLSSLPLEIIL